MKQNRDINALKDTLSKLVDTQGKYRENVRDDIIQEFVRVKIESVGFLGFLCPCYL